MESDSKRQKRARRTFTDEFKAGAVSLVLEKGKSVAQVARDLDLTASSLGKWVEQARDDAGKSTRGTLTTEEKGRAGAPAEGGPRAAHRARDLKKSGGLLREGERVKFAFIQAEKAELGVGRLCLALGVSRAGFYAWRRRPP